jgi:hypothetical protein
MRRVLLASVAGARFLHRPERDTADFQVLQDHYDHATFNGCYVTGDVSAGYLHHVKSMRSDEAKAKRAEISNSLQDLHTSSGATADTH